MTHKADLSAKQSQIEDICRRYEVRELMLFGSALREDFRSDSDLDFLVEFQPEAKVGLFRFDALREELEHLFGRPVDLVPKRGLKPLIREDVLRQAELVYAG